MLVVEHLRVEYGIGRNRMTAVDDASFEIASGGTMGLVGESGSGKSTIARAIVGLAPMSGGRVLIDGRDYSTPKSRRSAEFRSRIQMVFQDPNSSLNPRMTIGAALMEAVRMRQSRSRADGRKEALRALGLVGLGESALERYPFQFSGGQKQRISIARALAMRPEILVMDEVTSALDVSVQASVLNLLKDLQRELSLTYLFISHDLSVVGSISDHVAVMNRGVLVESGSVAEVFTNPQAEYTRTLLASIPRFGVRRERRGLTAYRDHAVDAIGG